MEPVGQHDVVMKEVKVEQDDGQSSQLVDGQFVKQIFWNKLIKGSKRKSSQVLVSFCKIILNAKQHDEFFLVIFFSNYNV